MPIFLLVMKISTRYIALIAVAYAAVVQSLPASAETIVDHVNRGTVIVEQPAALNARLQRHVAAETEATEEEEGTAVVQKVRAGYRVQVFDDNNVRTAKQEAQNRKNQIESRFQHLNVYVSFNSPYWRVKVGDFKSRSEAEAVMAEIRSAFPSMAKSLRIVRDRINQH